MARNPHGAIAICSRAGRLYLQFPRAWFGGNQKYLTLGLPDNRDNRTYASNLVRRIEWDYLQGEFDRSFAKYLPQQTAIDPQLNLKNLWAEYCAYKAKSLKPASIHYLVTGLGHHIDTCPHQQIDRALEVRDWLLEHTTPDMSRRVVAALATAVKWGVKHQRIAPSTNPFVEMSADIRVDKGDPQPNAFSPDERARVLAAFESSRYYKFYAPLVHFWLLTGCRPSEGIGLTWGQVSTDCNKIRFDRSLIHIGGKPIENHKSKTNRVRTFPCNEVLREFLLDYRDRTAANNPLVFPSPDGKPIDYHNFSARAWTKVVNPLINRHSTPYCCRDTFITDQIAKGIPVAVIARWCDNSVKTIERHYFDASALTHLKPL
jgi:integrase